MTAIASRARNGVFIAYSRHDGEAFAHRLRQDLEQRHITLWQDHTGMEDGRDWREQIREALNTVEHIGPHPEQLAAQLLAGWKAPTLKQSVNSTATCIRHVRRRHCPLCYPRCAPLGRKS